MLQIKLMMAEFRLVALGSALYGVWWLIVITESLFMLLVTSVPLQLKVQCLSFASLFDLPFYKLNVFSHSADSHSKNQ